MVFFSDLTLSLPGNLCAQGAQNCLLCQHLLLITDAAEYLLHCKKSMFHCAIEMRPRPND